jgi:peptide deformylase
MKEKERATIIAFLNHWAQLKGHRLDASEIYFPEDHLSDLDEQESQKPIDAKVEKLKLAMEHTSFDALTDQRKYGARFRDVCDRIETELSGKATSAISLVFPYDVVTRDDWESNGQRIKQWLSAHLHDMGVTLGSQTLLRVPNVPFEIRIDVRESDNHYVRCSRSTPDDPTLDQRIYEKSKEKIDKLQLYKDRGYYTILLLENSDIALMNRGIVSESIYRNLELFERVDVVCYVDSSIQGNPEYCFDVIKLEILREPNDFLHQHCEPVSRFDDAKLIVNALLRAIKSISKPWNRWLGLAANQIGFLKRIIALRMGGDRYAVLINPVLIEKKFPFPYLERCYSVDGIYLIKRYLCAKVKYQDIDGEFCEIILRGPSAIYQEMDHLDGRLVSESGFRLF